MERKNNKPFYIYKKKKNPGQGTKGRKNNGEEMELPNQ